VNDPPESDDPAGSDAPSSAPAADHLPPRRHLDAKSLLGLAHPLRVQIQDQLGLHGPATATQLAARLGESSGATSYHLRQLEKYGFVEEDPGRGSGRERWWRRVPGGISIAGHELRESEATRDATNLVLNEFNRGKQARIDHWRNTYHEWPREWVEASGEASLRFRLRPAELDELYADLERVLNRWIARANDRTDDDLVDVEMQLYAYPVGVPTPDHPGGAPPRGPDTRVPQDPRRDARHSGALQHSDEQPGTSEVVGEG
jgi:DNA-binding transcriptional ArsR family regulator